MGNAFTRPTQNAAVPASAMYTKVGQHARHDDDEELKEEPVDLYEIESLNVASQAQSLAMQVFPISIM